MQLCHCHILQIITCIYDFKVPVQLTLERVALVYWIVLTVIHSAQDHHVYVPVLMIIMTAMELRKLEEYVIQVSAYVI